MYVSPVFYVVLLMSNPPLLGSLSAEFMSVRDTFIEG